MYSAGITLESECCTRVTDFFLNHQRRPHTVSCFRATDATVLIIISRMTRQLSDCAAAAKEGTQTILTAWTTLFWNRIPRSRIHSCFTQGIEGPDGEQDRPNAAQDGDKCGERINVVRHGVYFEHGGVDNVG